MIRLAANLSFLFTELPFLDRFEAAARAGFKAVELAFEYETPPRAIAQRLRDHGLKLVLINTPLGNQAAGELGLAVLPGRQADLAEAFDRAMEYAAALDAPLIHFLAGNTPAGVERGAIDALFLGNIVKAADLAASVGRAITLEPLNARDRPGYHLSNIRQARALIGAAGRANVKLQLDLYHCEITEGDVVGAIEGNIDVIGHVQIANVPDRAEPTLAGIDYVRVLGRLDELGFSGHVGCEYVPAGETVRGLGWAERYLERP